MPFFRKQPVIIEAHQWHGTAEAATPIIDWALAHGGTIRYREARPSVMNKDGVIIQLPDFEHLLIDTLEGTMRADPGDWIVKGVQGEFYPVKDPIFRETYEGL